MRLRGGQRVTVADRVVEVAPAPRPVDPRVAAADLLRATDRIEYRYWTPERTPTPAWLAWRDVLRAVVRGEVTEIPAEPERYGAPPPPAQPAAPPTLIANIAAPGETLQEALARLAPLAAEVGSKRLAIELGAHGQLTAEDVQIETQYKMLFDWLRG